ncbi:MAG TPA: MBL fold metallo-hydrolase [Actinomycetota bacterium]|nr:MBL fold metallo-hydrolase [Actinomycetota bacterium]
MSEPLVVDTLMWGHARFTGVFVVAGERTALVESGSKATAPEVLAALGRLGVDDVDWIVVTHVHLDHAGGAAPLAAAFPRARVAVHRRGAPHLAAPEKLWASVGRVYGPAEMERLWGGVDPIAADRIHALDDGDVVDLGGRALRALDTPGHASHHHALLDDATGAMFVGDALGVRLPDLGVVRPATAPPEVDVPAALASIERIRAARPASLWFSHFGPHDRGARVAGVDDVCDEAAAALRRWESWVRAARRDAPGDVVDRVGRRARAELAGTLSDDELDRLDATAPVWVNVAGLARYLERADGA